MASSLGSLYIDMKARTADFVSGMTKAAQVSQAQMRQIQRQAAQMQSSIEDSFKRAALAAGAAAAGLAVALGHTADGMYQMAIAAKQAGAPVDQFSQLVEVADDVGVGIQAVNTGMQTLARNAASTSPQIQAYFKQLHIDPKAADSPVTLLTQTLQAIQKIHNPLQQQQAELLLLGRSGAQLKPLVDIANQLKKAMQGEADAGVSMSQRQAAAAIAWHQTVDTLQDDLRAVVMVLVTEFQPTFSQMVGQFTAWIEALRTSQGLQTFVNVIKAIADNIKLIGEAIAIAAIVRFVGQIVAAANDLMVAQKAFVALRVAMLALSGPIGWGLLAAGAVAAALALNKFQGQNAALLASVPRMQSGLQTLGQAIKDVGSQYGDAAQKSAAFLAQQIGISNFNVGQVALDVQQQQAALDKLQARRDAMMRATQGKSVADPLAGSAAMAATTLDQQISAQKKQLEDAQQKLGVAQAMQARANAAYDTARQHATMKGPTGTTFTPATAGVAKIQDPLTQLVGNLQAQSLQTGDTAVDQRAESIRKLTEAYAKYVTAGGNVTRADAELAQGLQAVNTTYTQALKVQQDQAEQYMQSLMDQVAVQKQGYDQQIAALSQGPQEAQFAQQRIQLTQQYTDRITELRGQMAILADQGKSTANVQAEITAQTVAQSAAVKALTDYQAKLADTEGSFSVGFQGALGALRDSAMDVAKQVQSAFTGLFDGLADAVASFVTTGKANFKDLVSSFISDLVKMETRILMSQALQSVFGGLNFNFMGGLAKGGVVDQSGITPFASGGIVTRPTLFAMANGMGLMGEAGPEAVMPLTRGPDGKLGVASRGGGNVQVIIENHTDAQPTTQQSQDGNGNSIIKVIIDQAVSKVNDNIARNGSTAKIMQQAFGLSRRGVPVGA